MQLRLSKEERLERAKRTERDTGNQAAGLVVVIEEENAATTPSTASASAQGTSPALEVVVVKAV
jgi:hypothetical protein